VISPAYEVPPAVLPFVGSAAAAIHSGSAAAVDANPLRRHSALRITCTISQARATHSVSAAPITHGDSISAAKGPHCCGRRRERDDITKAVDSAQLFWRILRAATDELQRGELKEGSYRDLCLYALLESMWSQRLCQYASVCGSAGIAKVLYTHSSCGTCTLPSRIIMSSLASVMRIRYSERTLCMAFTTVSLEASAVTQSSVPHT
jgi:hypothetical protein